MQIEGPTLEPGLILPPRHAIHSRGRLTLQGVEAFPANLFHFKECNQVGPFPQPIRHTSRHCGADAGQEKATMEPVGRSSMPPPIQILPLCGSLSFHVTVTPGARSTSLIEARLVHSTGAMALT